MDFPEIISRLMLECTPMDDQQVVNSFEPLLGTLCHHMKEMFTALKNYQFDEFHYNYGAIDHWIERLENFTIDYNCVNFTLGQYVKVVHGDLHYYYQICVAEHVNFPDWVQNLEIHQQDFVKFQMQRIINVYRDFVATGNFTDYWYRKPIVKHAIFLLKCLFYQHHPPEQVDDDSGLSTAGSLHSDGSEEAAANPDDEPIPNNPGQ